MGKCILHPEAMDEIAYPVGAIYLSVTDVNPAALFGGTWEQIKDTFLLACGDTYAAGSTGGEATHTLTVDEMPRHRHQTNESGRSGNFSSGTGYSTGVSNDYGDSNIMYTTYDGGNQPHNNMPPYLAVYMWKRVA